jgi:hypothetical protein
MGWNAIVKSNGPSGSTRQLLQLLTGIQASFAGGKYRSEVLIQDYGVR